MNPKSTSSGLDSDVDIWRETRLRYAGYTNEVGESFRPLFPRFVRPSYAIACAYVLGDTWDKRRRCVALNVNPTRQTVDTFVWQILASVMIPGVVINRTVAFTRALVNLPQGLPRRVVQWTPTVTGLAIIPLIIHPIDRAVDYAMDTTFRASTSSS